MDTVMGRIGPVTVSRSECTVTIAMPTPRTTLGEDEARAVAMTLLEAVVAIDDTRRWSRWSGEGPR